MSTIVTPGRRLGLTQEYEAGPGTYVRGGMVYSSLLGVQRKQQPAEETKTEDSKDATSKPTLSVERSTTKFAIPAIGSEVLGRITRLNPRAATVAIIMVGDIPCQEDFSGTIRVQDIRATEKDLVQMINMFRPGDIVRAQVISLGDQRSYFLATTLNEHGVVFAQSSQGNTMVPISWEEMKDPQTGHIEKRKCAKTF